MAPEPVGEMLSVVAPLTSPLNLSLSAFGVAPLKSAPRVIAPPPVKLPPPTVNDPTRSPWEMSSVPPLRRFNLLRLVADPPTLTAAPDSIVMTSMPLTVVSVPVESLLKVISSGLLLLTLIAPWIVAPLFTVIFARPPAVVSSANFSSPLPRTAPSLRSIFKSLSFSSLALIAAFSPPAPPVTVPLMVTDTPPL